MLILSFSLIIWIHLCDNLFIYASSYSCPGQCRSSWNDLHDLSCSYFFIFLVLVNLVTRLLCRVLCPLSSNRSAVVVMERFLFFIVFSRRVFFFLSVFSQMQRLLLMLYILANSIVELAHLLILLSCIEICHIVSLALQVLLCIGCCAFHSYGKPTLPLSFLPFFSHSLAPPNLFNTLLILRKNAFNFDKTLFPIESIRKER